MELSLLLKALILGVVEGLTEFLPISSTGHMILVGSLLNFNGEVGKVFEVVIQSGAMLAIIIEYRRKFSSVVLGMFREAAARKFVLNLVIAFLPALVLGFLFSKIIKQVLFRPIPVAAAFVVGAFVILWVERRKLRVRVEHVDSMSTGDAFKVGLAQTLALIPGTSRSGATIIGGMLFGLSRRAATEFSFFLAVPTLLAAAAYDLFKHRALLHKQELGVFAIGFVTAFLSAFLCIRWLLRYISRHNFNAFAWYRIAFGVLILVTAYFGVVNWNMS
jgi:undecaprenyl-diphosphatase